MSEVTHLTGTKEIPREVQKKLEQLEITRLGGFRQQRVVEDIPGIETTPLCKRKPATTGLSMKYESLGIGELELVCAFVAQISAMRLRGLRALGGLHTMSNQDTEETPK